MKTRHHDKQNPQDTGWTIPISSVPDTGHSLNKDISMAWLSEALANDSTYRPPDKGDDMVGSIHLDLLPIQDDSGSGASSIHVRGELHVRVHTDCSRCLRGHEVSLETHMELVMVPEDKNGTKKQDNHEDEDEDDTGLGVATYTGQELDLSPVVRDEMLLQLPMHPVCKENCAGLCDQCGHDLNQGACTCAAPIDHRWAGLKDIKLSEN